MYNCFSQALYATVFSQLPDFTRLQEAPLLSSPPDFIYFGRARSSDFSVTTFFNFDFELSTPRGQRPITMERCIQHSINLSAGLSGCEYATRRLAATPGPVQTAASDTTKTVFILLIARQSAAQQQLSSYWLHFNQRHNSSFHLIDCTLIGKTNGFYSIFNRFSAQNIHAQRHTQAQNLVLFLVYV